ncbi:hypothetical protein Q4574_00585 [Aliiglaciecola sp. 3_MG-2023]|uniref:hypothetical protein n=1 Tax=Aliiglaciecola sp. 3_MG-2023 TaxID=3062644 RepID=UPI0026E3A8CB|nr:hypothetical protein [Aliiglaciecola sp. 3_MG-2023]MDO6691752.1 hypothetical protein [Aliiglaciecola sp. 3_MG-2023]
MIKLTLSHQYTPENLKAINTQIETVLAAAELDDKLLKQLIETRDEVVVDHLKSLDQTAEKLFSESELETNKSLTKVIDTQLKESLKQLSGLIRGKKSVNKYK